jgi:16S rRNA (guanine966-N2)-methyltransferase
MRIIAGKAKGHKLKPLSGMAVRPTTDRVREALFSALGTQVVGARVLDLFAGSGALGLEALSRGALSAVFVDKSKKVCLNLGRNIDSLGFEDQSRLMATDWAKALKLFARERRLFDLVLLDPPYEHSAGGSVLERVLATLGENTLLAAGAVIVAEHPRASGIILPESLRRVRTRVYGDTGLTLVEETGQ